MVFLCLLVQEGDDSLTLLYCLVLGDRAAIWKDNEMYPSEIYKHQEHNSTTFP